MTIERAFILAAGLGTRMRPYTDTRPKPLVEVGGISLLDHALDHLVAEAVTKTVINTHYLAEQIRAHLKNRKSPELTYSHEPVLLDTGGGIVKTLNQFNDEPFYVVSGDSFWNNGPQQSALTRLRNFWNPETMDILLLLQPIKSMILTKGVGDYDIDARGRATRSLNKTGAHMFTSIRINHPRIFKNAPEGAFSYLKLMDEAQQNGRLFGLVHDGDWHHISTPADLDAVNVSCDTDE